MEYDEVTDNDGNINMNINMNIGGGDNIKCESLISANDNVISGLKNGVGNGQDQSVKSNVNSDYK